MNKQKQTDLPEQQCNACGGTGRNYGGMRCPHCN